ncbi:hypothetical protein OSTOST_03399, partial [Ostertagia ostertagi]
MSTISVCKANLTKAHSALEATKGKIPQNLIDPFNSKTIPPADELQRLDERQDAIRTHLSNMRAALRTVRERHQAFLDFINKSTDPENDNAAYMDYMQQSKIEDATVAADNLIHVLHTNLEEACARLERLRSTIAPNQQQEHDRSQHELEVEATPQIGDYERTQPHYPQMTSRDIPSYNAADTHYALLGNQHAAGQPTIQLGKLTLEPFTGDITQFQRFWRAFEVAVHNDSSISATYKFLYLQSLLKGEAQIVLQDMDPDECNYYELIWVRQLPPPASATIHVDYQCIKTIPPADELQRLDERQDAIRTHLSNMRAALRTVRERHQAFLDFINKSTDPENDNAAYMDYMQQSKIEDATVAADNLIHVLHTNLEEACARLERLRSTIAPNQQQEHDRSQHELEVEATPQIGDYERTQPHYPQMTSRDIPSYNAADTHYALLDSERQRVISLVEEPYHCEMRRVYGSILNAPEQPTNQKKRTFITFGGHETSEMTGVVEVNLLDAKDRILKVHLTSKDTVTLPQTPP